MPEVVGGGPPPEKLLRVPTGPAPPGMSADQLKLIDEISARIRAIDTELGRKGIRTSLVVVLETERAELVRMMDQLMSVLSSEELGKVRARYDETVATAKWRPAGGPPWPWDVFLDALGDAVRWLGDMLERIWDGFVRVLSTVADWLRRNVIDPIWRAAASLMDQLGVVIGSAMGVAVTALTKMVHPGSPLEPWTALPMFGAIAASMLAIQTTFLGVNAVHPLKEIIGDTANAMVCKFLGFEHLSSAFWGALGTEILNQPLRLWARSTFRARVPGHAEADEMLWHGQISEARWHELHTYEGWSDELIAAHYASQWRNPSVRDIGMITDAVALEPATVERMLRELGYNPEDLPLLSAVMARRPVIDELKALRADLIRETVEGAMTIGELESALRALGAKDSELAIIRQIVAIRRARAQRKQIADAAKDWTGKRVAALTEAYRRDLLSEEEYLEELLDAGIEPAIAAQTLYLEQVRKLPRPRRT